MPDIVVRCLEDSDLEGFLTVCSLTYNDGLPYTGEQRQIRSMRPFIAEHKGEVAGAFQVLDMTASRLDTTFGCAGVAGVAVLPHRRKDGVGSAMMSWLPHQMRAEGIPFCSLYAFSEGFYRRFGYEVVGRRLKIVCPSSKLPKVSSSLPVRLLGPSDYRQVMSCYEAFARRRSGLNLRNEAQWGRVLGENKPLAIYAAGDPVEAYVAVSHKVEFWSTDHISEVIWSTAEGYSAVLGTLAQLGMNKTALSWYEPSDSPFLTKYVEQGIEVRVERPIMFRVNDVPAALRSLQPCGEGRFTVRVFDSLIPENEGPWLVEFGAGKVLVDRTSEADLELDVRQLAQAILGEPSLAQLAGEGLVSVRSVEALRAATELLPAIPTYCSDFF